MLFWFAVLGVAADLAVRKIKYVVSALRIRLFVFGILLGFITTMPELSVGINAIIDGESALSVGNLLGGTLTLLGLVLGASLILNRRIVTDGRMDLLWPKLGVIVLPFFLGVDGHYGLGDGLVMVGSYLGLIYYLYLANQAKSRERPEKIHADKVGQALLLALGAVIVVLLASHWIVDITLVMLKNLRVSSLVIGVVVFGIGTNLPEITLTLTAWRKKANELSLSHLLSAAFTHVLILGILAIIRPLVFMTEGTYWTLFAALVLVLFLVSRFYVSGKSMDRREGWILLSIYFLFLIINFWLF